MDRLIRDYRGEDSTFCNECGSKSLEDNVLCMDCNYKAKVYESLSCKKTYQRDNRVQC
jgi:uncharacterized membrane protein YvbJ